MLASYQIRFGDSSSFIRPEDGVKEVSFLWFLLPPPSLSQSRVTRHATTHHSHGMNERRCPLCSSDSCPPVCDKDYAAPSNMQMLPWSRLSPRSCSYCVGGSLSMAINCAPAYLVVQPRVVCVGHSPGHSQTPTLHRAVTVVCVATRHGYNTTPRSRHSLRTKDTQASILHPGHGTSSSSLHDNCIEDILSYEKDV